MAAEPLSERVITPMAPALVQAIDDHRFQNRFASRSEAIRTLLANSLGIAAPTSAAAPQPTARNLIASYFTADPSRVQAWGYSKETTVRQAVERELTLPAKGAAIDPEYLVSMTVIARRQFEIFDGDDSPEAKAICDLLRPFL